MLWHPRCRWPARLSLPPTPRHGPRKNATRLFPVVQGESATLDAFYDKIWMGHIYWSCYLNETANAVASTSRLRCSHSRMKSSPNPPLRLWVIRVVLTVGQPLPVHPDQRTSLPSDGTVSNVPNPDKGTSYSIMLISGD